MSAEAVYFDLTTGRPSVVAATMRRRVGAYTRDDLGRSFKIGITNNPIRRFSNGYSKNYDEMIVLYESLSLESVSEVERDLVEHNEGFTKNRIAGGGGDYGEPPYYLYIVLRSN